MKLKELIEKIDKSPDNRHEACVHSLGEKAFELYGINWVDQDRLVYYWLACWYCTDTWVGFRAYFFDGEFVALSYQPARKSNEVFEWSSKDAYESVRTYVESFSEQQEPSVSILNMDEEFGDGYRVAYNSQILPHLKAMLDGRRVKIVRSKEKSYDDFHSVDIIVNKEKQEIDVSDLLFSYLINEDES